MVADRAGLRLKRTTTTFLAALGLVGGSLSPGSMPAVASSAADYTIWQPSTVAVPYQAVTDPNSVEVGVKFRVDVVGQVTGLRFFKGAGNGGTHLGNLWSSTGALLASATFTNETATGWQQVNFATPVSINPGVTYVASYFAPAGHYAYARGFFASSGVDNPPLHALASGVDGLNGVFAYSNVSTFPSSDFNSSNYWVDVVFNAIVTTPPFVIAESPNPGATGVALNPEATATFNEEVQPSSISFVLTDPTGTSVPATMVFELYGQTRAVTLQPNQNLTPSTAYTATVSGAIDRSGNTMPSPASWSFTTTNVTSPSSSSAGQWGPDQAWPIVAIHSVVLSTGSVLQWDLQSPGITEQVWNPVTNSFTSSAMLQSGWCAGQVQLADGRVLEFGGTENNAPANRFAAIYDPSSNTTTRMADMHLPRWYPAGVRLGDGRIVVISGQVTESTWADTPEVFDPASNTWTLLSGVSTSDVHEDLYPNVYLLPSGKILVFATSTGQTRLLDVAAQTWTPGPTSPIFNGSSAMFAPGKFIVSGGTAVPAPADSAQSLASVAQAAILDMTAPNPAWQMVSPMNFARGYHNLVTLPDGKVLAVGGTPTFSTAAAVGVLPAEEWDPTTGRWTTLAPERDPRMNHSTAVLLPDGTVLAAGGGHEPGFSPFDYSTAEVYQPPYLFRTGGPLISSAPASSGYGAAVPIGTPNPSAITSVALMGLSAQTHKYDTSASYVPLAFSTTSAGLNVTFPSSANVAPPGYYMLFLIDGSGVPSRAQMIQLIGPDLAPPTVGGVSPAANATGVPVSLAPSATFSKPVQQTSVAFTVKDPSGNPVAGSISYNSAMNTATFTPSTDLAYSTAYTATLSGAVDLAGNAMTGSVSWSFTTGITSCPCSLWSSSTLPSVPAAGDPSAVELGVKFSSSTNGFITGIRFYKGAGNTGTHVGNLWSSTGILLASAAFASETASGWQQVSFPGGVAVTAGTTYVASYFTPTGHYAADGTYFASSGVDNAPLHAPANTLSPNGIYRYSSSSTFPSLSNGRGSNYWVDVVFNITGSSDTVPPTVSSVAPASGASSVSPATSISATFSKAVQQGSISLNVQDSGGRPVTGTVSYDPSTYTVAFKPASQLASTTYVTSVTASDLAGNAMTTPFTWSFTTIGQTCPCTMWSSSTVPSMAAVSDAHPIEVGVQFTSDVNGSISGIRFYKGVRNAGTHIGNLWSSTGTLLATATFTNETVSGWQQVTFASPIPVSAGTTYVASYFTPVGYYAADSGYFGSVGWNNQPLHALANGVSGNGVYAYASSSTFPTSSFKATNYWVDVVFTIP